MFIFSHFNLDLGYWYIIWKVSPMNRWTLKKPSAHYIRVVGDLMQNLSSLLISLVVTCALINDYRALLDLPSSESEFLRTCRTPLHIKSCFLVWWGRDGELVWLRKSIAWQRGLLALTRVRRKLCMVPSHSCHIYGTWRSKETEGGFKVMTWYGDCPKK